MKACAAAEVTDRVRESDASVGPDDLLTAERELASARSTAIDSCAQLLTAAAALTFAVGG